MSVLAENSCLVPPWQFSLGWTPFSGLPPVVTCKRTAAGAQGRPWRGGGTSCPLCLPCAHGASWWLAVLNLGCRRTRAVWSEHQGWGGDTREARACLSKASAKATHICPLRRHSSATS